MSTKACGSNVAQAVKELLIQWQETKVHWRDTKSMMFEKDYLEELPGSAARTAMVMDELDLLLEKVKHDCE